MHEGSEAKVKEDRWIDVPATHGEHEVDTPIQLRPGVDKGDVLLKTFGGPEVHTSLLQLRRGLRLIEEEQAQ